MLKIIALLSCATVASAMIVCTPQICDGVKQPVLNCAGSVFKNGGFCGCTDVCARVEGEACAGHGMLMIMGGPTMHKCDTGLHCKTVNSLYGTGVCVRN